MTETYFIQAMSLRRADVGIIDVSAGVGVIGIDVHAGAEAVDEYSGDGVNIGAVMGGVHTVTLASLGWQLVCRTARREFTTLMRALFERPPFNPDTASYRRPGARDGRDALAR